MLGNTLKPEAKGVIFYECHQYLTFFDVLTLYDPFTDVTTVLFVYKRKY